MWVCVPSCFSQVWLFVTLWTTVCQASLFMGFSRQEYWSSCLALLQGIFPTRGSNLCLLCHPVLAGGFFTTSASWEAPRKQYLSTYLHPCSTCKCRLWRTGAWDLLRGKHNIERIWIIWVWREAVYSMVIDLLVLSTLNFLSTFFFVPWIIQKFSNSNYLSVLSFTFKLLTSNLIALLPENVIFVICF